MLHVIYSSCGSCVCDIDNGRPLIFIRNESRELYFCIVVLSCFILCLCCGWSPTRVGEQFFYVYGFYYIFAADFRIKGMGLPCDKPLMK